MSNNESKEYILKISMNVLNHLGLNLYSNNAAVLSEVVANAWDADATEVHIDYSGENGGTITIIDNGFGMDYSDVQEKYLFVGREKREKDGALTPLERKPMGRKGIGKLSMFSIAEKIFVYTKKERNDGQAFMLDAAKIKQHIDREDHSQSHNYLVPREPFNGKTNGGTVIEIQQFKRKFTQNTFNGLRKRIARRFSIINEKHNFNVFLDGKEITYADRDYFHKARFLFQYKDDFSQYCEKLDKNDNGENLSFPREYRFNDDGKADKNGKYAVRGWIAIARRSNDLDNESKDDNLNNITLVVRGKVAQEDLLHEHRLGGMITKYMYGEIEADFLDTDDEDDIATSSRQKIIQNDSRYQSLMKFINGELKHIWTETNTLKDKKGAEHAMALVPSLREWYENLKHKPLKEKARKIFGVIDSSCGDDGKFKRELFAYGVLAFEKQKMKHSLDLLDKINEDNVQQLLAFFHDVDDIEAAHYHEIVQERLIIINELRQKTLEKVLESDLRDYLFNRLWLFDPAWERTTENAEMEKTMQLIVDGVEKNVRPDIKYRKPQREHVIIELKRPGRVLEKTEIEKQLTKYIKAVKNELKKRNDDEDLPINGICIVGEWPRGWNDPEQRKNEEESLKPLRIRIMTYTQLIESAEKAYRKYLKVHAEGEKLTELIERIKKGE